MSRWMILRTLGPTGQSLNCCLTASNKTADYWYTIEPDTSYLGRDLRMDVNYAWIDFLDNLGISDASNDESDPVG